MAERRGLLLGARIAGGTVAAGIAAVVVAGVGLIPFPVLGAAPAATEVEPAPADQSRVCLGSAMRLGDATGADADTAFAIGTPTTDAFALGDLERTALESADAGVAGSRAAPESLRTDPADDEAVAGAQVQDVETADFSGLAASSCAEPSSSIWLVGGATTVGRTTLLVLENPTQVEARASIEIYGEDGPVTAPGTSGIEVPAGRQVVLSLAGFAPGIASPVVHVTSRGGLVVAALQHSIVRGLDAVGVETAGSVAAPAESVVIPGVRVVDRVGTNRALGFDDWQDVVPVVRIAVPGDADGTATVSVVPEQAASEGEEPAGTSFEVKIDAGSVAEVALDAGGEGDHEAALADGMYTVRIESDVPVVAGARVSTAVDSGGDVTAPDAFLQAPPSDLAWFGGAPALAGSALVVVPDGPSPVVSLVNPTPEDVSLELVDQRDGTTIPVELAGGGAASLAVEPGVYRIDGAEGLAVGVSFAAPGQLAAFVLSPPRPVAGPISLRVD